MNNRKWTKNEEEVILSEVEKNPFNLSMAFIAISSKIDRTPSAISYRWYKTDLRERSIAFMTISKKSVSKNKKNITSNTNNNTKEIKLSIWKRIINIITNKK